MHIKRLLSGSLAALMVASSFNVPVVRAAEDEPTEVVEEAKVDTSGDDDVIVDDVPEVETEKTTEVSEPEEITGLVEETGDESANEEALVVEEDAEEQKVVKAANKLSVTFEVQTLDGVTLPEAPSATELDITEAGTINVPMPTFDAVTGASFDGWYAGETKLELNEGNYSQSITADDETDGKAVTYTAKFKKWSRKVTFNKNTTDTNVTGVPADLDVEYGTDASTILSGKNPTGSPEEKTFLGWGSSADATEPVNPSTLLPDSEEATQIELFAIWKENTSEAIDITGNTFTYSITTDDDKALTYTGSAITPKVVVKNGDDVVGSSNYEVKYFANSDCSGEEATLKDAGTYYAKITAKGTAYTGEKKGVEVKVAKLSLTKGDIKLVAPMGDNTGNEIDGFNLFYDDETKSAEGTNPATVKGVTTKKVIPMVSVIDSEDNVVPITDEQKSFANNNVVSTATTKASVTITFTAEQLKNYQIGDSETATTLTKEFTIKDGKEDVFIDAASENTKATISNTDSKAGKAVKYGKIWHKKVEDDIPAVALNTIQLKIAKTSEAYLPNGDIGDFFDSIKDTNGKDITGQFDFDKELTEDGAKLILTAKEDSNLYEGSYEYSYKFVDEECTEHTWVRKVIPATFEADGAWWYECSACGERATADDRDEIKKQLGLDELTVVSGTIAKLDATKISFWIHNNPDQLHNYSDGFNFNVENGQVNGTALKDFKVNDYGRLFHYQTLS